MNANDTKRSEGQLEHASTARSGLGRRVRMMVGTAVLATAGLSMSACTPAALVGLGTPTKHSTTKTVSKPKPVTKPKPVSKPTSIPKTSAPKPVTSSTPTPAPEPTQAPTPTPTQAPTPTPTQAPIPTPTQAPIPTPTQAPIPTPTQAPIPTPTPTPTQAPIPTPTPTPPASVAPDASNTGVPAGTRLTVHEGDIVVTTPGTVIDGLDVHGFVKVYAANVTVKNSIIRGGVATSNTGLVNAMSASAVNTKILNNTLVPSNPSIWIDGVFGHDMTVIGNEMYNTVDGIGTFKTGLSDSGMINVDIEGNYIHDLYYAGPDSNHGDNHTHNDGIQIQGGGNIKIVGNTLDCLAGSASNMRSPYYPAATGQAIALTPNVSAIHDLLIDHNWMDGGAQGIGGTVVKPLADNIVISNNHFGQLEWPITRGGTKARWAIVLPNAPMTMTGNVYDGTGYPALIFRGNP